MTHINKPLALRTALNMHKALAGHKVLAIANKKQAYKMWARIESENETEDHLSNGLAREFRRYQWLIQNVGIDVVLEMLESDRLFSTNNDKSHTPYQRCGLTGV